MKFVRYISIALLFMIVVLLVLSNIFYRDLRKYFDSSYVEIELNDELINDLEKSKKGNADFLLYSKTDKKLYSKYEKILVIAKIIRKKDREVVRNAKIEAILYDRNGNIVKSIDNNDKVSLTYDEKNDLWKGYFFPLNTDIDGELKLEIKAYPDSPEAPVSVYNYISFIANNKNYKIDKNMALIGINSIERISKRIIISLNGKEVDWNYIPEWVDILSADGVFMNVGITPSFQEDINASSPWNREKINESDILAEKLNQRGKKFAGYIKAFKVEGAYIDKIGYMSSYSLTENGFSEGGAISYSDENRKSSIQKLFALMMQNKNYNFIGFSDFFPEYGDGLELCDLFFKELQIEVPAEWKDWDITNKLKYFSEKLKNKDFLTVFERWKRYYLVSVMKEIIEKSGKNKPVFYYIDYESLKKNPEILDVLSAASIDFFVVNFALPYYDLAKEIRNLRQTFISEYSDRLIFSYEIDYKKNLEFQDVKASGIDFYWSAYFNSIKEMSKKSNLKGLIINDLYNAMSGKRGPYSPLEWMFGIGNIFYEFKKMNSMISLAINYYLPANIEYNKEFYILFNFKNFSPNDIKNVKLDLIDYDGNVLARETLVKELKSGNIEEARLPVTLNIKTEKMVKNSEVVGLRFSWEEKTEDGTFSRSYILSESFNLIKKE
ncbi:MAG: hypothetical protein N2258_01480 [Brevinematales bacterium]|nr:hypothetical protein [Brevinematales bacterium]